MSKTDDGISAIVDQVIGTLAARGVAVPRAEPRPFEGRGVVGSMDDAVRAATSGLGESRRMPLETRERVIASMRRAMLANVDRLSHMALDETGLGRLDDKLRKNRLAAARTPGTEDLRPIAFSGDHGLTLVERAPYGVIGSITPTTNPTETIICNAIGMVAGGNAVVFNPHPSARVVSLTCIDLLNRAIAEAGGPRALLFSVDFPSIESAQELMAHPGVRLLVVTGGPGVVRAAMQSGKKVIAAGPGNPPVVVDETADIPRAGRDIVAGASLDNNIVCIAEKEIIAVRSIVPALKNALSDAGGYEVKGHSAERLTQIIIENDLGPGKSSPVRRDLIGKDAVVIMGEAGLSCPAGTRLVFFEAERAHPLVWTEQMMPVLPLVGVDTAAEAIDLAREVERGCGHTAVMHSRNIDNLSRMAHLMDVSIFVKNGPSYAGLSFGGEGFTSFTIASPTGEGLTRASTFTRERRCTLVDYFRIV
ncbi:MAG: aldehyde dehydrogenase EutE [Candidatus Eisenbacteria bacterium]|nr:aldehyde dehydrogenase EutE [Candidatus Eisenbacteria bacterium]